MADSTITSLNSLTSGQVDRTNDVLEIADISANESKKITPLALMGITGNAVGDTDSQTLTNKILTTPAISSPVLSGTISGTYTLGGTPTFPSSVVTLTGSQTLTNKILTSPTINTPTISNATITANAIAGFTTANTGTVYGVSVVLGVIQSAALLGQVNTAAIQNGAVTPSKLATGAATSSVATDQTTTSVTYADLATVGPAVTVTVGANGIVLALWGAGIYNVAANKFAGIALSGANVVAATDTDAIRNDMSAFQGTQAYSKLFTGLASGSTTFTLKYRTASGTANFFARYLTVVPL